MLPARAGSIILKKCGSESELEHQKYAKSALQLTFLIKTGINGFDIYKHAVVFAERALDAKCAQVTSETQNSEGLKKRKNGDRNGHKSDKSKQDDKKCSFWGRLGAKKVKKMIEFA